MLTDSLYYIALFITSLSHKSIQLLDSLKLLNSLLHSRNWALALLAAAVWRQQRSLTSGDSVVGAVTSGQEVRDLPLEAEADPALLLRSSEHPFPNTGLFYSTAGTDIQSLLGEMSAVCPSRMLQVQEDSGHVSPTTDQLYSFGSTGQTLRASVYSCGHSRQHRPRLELIQGQGASQSRCR